MIFQISLIESGTARYFKDREDRTKILDKIIIIPREEDRTLQKILTTASMAAESILYHRCTKAQNEVLDFSRNS
jgi:hypothetical protein